MASSSSLLLLPLAALLITTAAAVNFTCTATSTCTSLVEYIPTNATTYAAASTLFQVPYLSLLAANNLPTSTPKTHVSTSITVPIPCRCAKTTGASDRTPVYTVKSGDGLDAIARSVFMQLVTFQEIQAANELPDPNKIVVGQKLRIPLPCSCDEVGGRRVVHLGHVVAAGSSLSGIAAQFGSDAETLMKLNGIKDAKDLLAGQVIDVPLQACSSSINNTSPDYNLLVPNGSYALTAKDCILCRCSSYELDCHPTQGLSTSKCPTAKCGSLYVGNTSTSGCNVKTCAYDGYTEAPSFSILTNTTIQSTCSNGGAPGLCLKESRWTVLLILQATLLSYWFL